MLYQLFSWLNKTFNIPGLGAFQFLTSRIAMAILLSLFIATVFGKKMILFLQRKQIGATKKGYSNNGRHYYLIKYFNSHFIVC